MNRFKTLIAAGALVVATAATSLPAQAAEYYVVHPDGRITKEYRHGDYSGYSYFSFSLGAPVIWLDDSYRHYGYRHHHSRWERAWREHRRHERWERRAERREIRHERREHKRERRHERREHRRDDDHHSRRR